MSDTDARTRAVEWFVLLASGTATPQERRDWAAWHAADPAHQVEWDRVERVQRMMSGVPADLASPALRRPAPRRRQLLKSAAVAGTAGVLGYGLWQGTEGSSPPPGSRTTAPPPASSIDWPSPTAASS
ncbi:DUF4880 domain-containing protein [Roseateles chitinivorans]|uniref:DUF4880 domain-containing protein n=1 Tax=Roseateles chitinivorans TaxID=2917965 RepID=UPI003D66796C